MFKWFKKMVAVKLVLCCPKCTCQFSDWFINKQGKRYCWPCAGILQAETTKLNEDNGIWLPKKKG